MKRNNVVMISVFLCAIIMVSGCASTKSDPCPTTAPCPTSAQLSCPTSAPQACPTVAAQEQPAQSGWRKAVAGLANIVVTVDPGDKCSMVVKNPISNNILFYEIEVKDAAYQNYLIGIETLAPGKTLADLEALPKYSMGEPSWVTFVQENVVGPMSRTWSRGAVDYTKGPLYITCLVEDPTSLKMIGNLGPIELPSK